jgi:predicted ATPase
VVASPQLTHVLSDISALVNSEFSSDSSLPYHDVTAAIQTDELVNPGMSMPLSFVRRFHNEPELEYACNWMKQGVSGLLETAIASGVSASRTHGCCYDSNIIILAFSLESGSRDVLGQLRGVVDSIAQAASTLNGSILQVSSPSSSVMHMSIVLPGDIMSASFFIFKIAAKFDGSSVREARITLGPDFIKNQARQTMIQPKDRKRIASARLLFCVAHHGDIMWRAGVGGSVIPYGAEVDLCTKQFQRVLVEELEEDKYNDCYDQPVTYCPAETVRRSLEVTGGHKVKLITFKDISDHPGWMEPHDVLTPAFLSIYQDSQMIGRRDVRAALSQSLESLLLTNESSINLIEAKAGFGKSVVAREVSDIARELGIPTVVTATASGEETQFGIWIKLCAYLIGELEKEGSTIDLLEHLPEECSVAELRILRDVLPLSYDVGEDFSFEDKAAHTTIAARTALFGRLLESLILAVSPIVFVIEDLQWADSASWKLLLHASSEWAEGCMILATTRPVSSIHSFEYSEICQSKMSQRWVLSELNLAELSKLAKRYLGHKASRPVVDKLKVSSLGFPFLAVELLRDAAASFETSVLGSDIKEDSGTGLRHLSFKVGSPVTSSEMVAASTKDSYSEEEIRSLQGFYRVFSQDAGWDRFGLSEDVEYFERPDQDGSIRAAKATATVPNSTPHGILAEIISGVTNSAHWSGALTGGEAGDRRVVETINDHSCVVYQQMKLPSMFTDRDSVCKFVWKEMEPGTILFLSSSVEREECPESTSHVRLFVKASAFILRAITSSNSVSESCIIMFDPGGIASQNLTKRIRMNFLQHVGLHVKHFSVREDQGVPLLKALVKTRMEKLAGMKLLGYVAVMGDALNNIAQLATILEQSEEDTQSMVNLFLEEDLFSRYGAISGQIPAFPHIFIAEVAVDAMSKEDFKRAHIISAECLLASIGGAQRSHLNLLTAVGHHYARAEDHDKARLYLMKSALFEAALDDNSEAEELLTMLLSIIRSQGPLRTAPSDELAEQIHSRIHEELCCLVNLGMLEEAAELVGRKEAPIVFACLPGSQKVRIQIANLRRSVPKPSSEFLSSGLKHFFELQSSMWAKLAEKGKGAVSRVEYASRVFRQLEAGVKSGKTDTFVIALLAVSRYFVSVGEISQAHKYQEAAAENMPEDESLLLEGWEKFCSGEMRCCCGEFEEGADDLFQAAEAWLENGQYALWNMAVKQYTHAQCLLGNLTDAANFLETCRASTLHAVSEDILADNYFLQTVVAVEMGENQVVKRADAHSQDTLGGAHARVHSIPAVVMLVGEGNLSPKEAFEILSELMQTIPSKSRDWTWSIMLYWGLEAYNKILALRKQQTTDKEFSALVISKMKLACNKLREMTNSFPGCKSMSAICDGYLAQSEGNISKACDVSKGGYRESIKFSLESGTVLIGARARTALALVSREDLQTKLAMAVVALEVFSEAKAYSDWVSCLRVLLQLDPKNAAFGELARNNSRRRSTSRLSFGSSAGVVEQLEQMKDVPLSGRKEELTILIKSANALRTGANGAQCVSQAIIAAGGMGKSAILKSFVKDLNLSSTGLEVIMSSASQFETTTPLYIWKKVFQSVMQVYNMQGSRTPSGSRSVVVQEVLLATLGGLVGQDRAKSWHPLLNPLLPFDFPETSETSLLSTSGRLFKCIDFLYEILANLDKKILICLEDTHWADEMSWDLIEKCHGANDILVIVTSRPHESGDDLVSVQHFFGLDGVNMIKLGPLEDSALRKHIAELLEVEQISEPLMALIENRTGGNLLYIHELVSSLIESGMLAYSDVGVDLKNDIDEVAVPDNVQAVIASRIAGLSPSQQSLLQTASVIGREFTIHMIVQVHPASEMLFSIGNDIKEVVRKRLVERVKGNSDDDDSVILHFSHKFVQESIYESCLISTRKDVHRSIAGYLEIEKSDQLNNYYSVIAHHYTMAEEYRYACLHWQLASEVSSKMEMPKAVVTSLDKWIALKSKLDIRDHDPAINGRYSCAKEEEGMILASRAMALTRTMGNSNIVSACLSASRILVPNKHIPSSKAGQIAAIVKGISFLLYKTKTGSNLSYDPDPDPVYNTYYSCLFQAANLAFRRSGDSMTMIVILLECFRSSRMSARLRLTNCQGFIVLAPIMGLKGVGDYLHKQVIRLNEVLDHVDVQFGSAVCNFANGLGYSGKGELKQGGSYFIKASDDYLNIRDMDLWANCTTFGCMSIFEAGNLSKSMSILKKGFTIAKTSNHVAANNQFAAVILDQCIYSDSNTCQEIVEEYNSRPEEMFGDRKSKQTSWGYASYIAGKISVEEFMKVIMLSQENCSFLTSHLYTGDRVASSLAFFAIYDKCMETDGANTAVAGVSTNDMLKCVGDNEKFLEKLGKVFECSRPWALFLKGSIQRRRGKLSQALVSLTNGVEAATRINGKSALCMLLYEKGCAEESLEVGGTLSKKKTDGTNASVHAENTLKGDCINSYKRAAEIGKEIGMIRVLDCATAKLKNSFGFGRSPSNAGISEISGMLSSRFESDVLGNSSDNDYGSTRRRSSLKNSKTNTAASDNGVEGGAGGIIKMNSMSASRLVSLGAGGGSFNGLPYKEPPPSVKSNKEIGEIMKRDSVRRKSITQRGASERRRSSVTFGVIQEM